MKLTRNEKLALKAFLFGVAWGLLAYPLGFVSRRLRG